ncbi:MAG: type III secretion system stator protein SctL [Pseudomonas proteolytica]|uniref:type III secretion system stator protein SctL n=1 Tax=Pseudomonas proteolytica TaxID=219574 RepID=UPI003F313A0C
MFCRHKIDLPKGSTAFTETLIPRETLANYAHAHNVLEHSKAQARQLLKLAEKKREKLLEQAGLEIWRRADAQFKRWEVERQAMYDNLERYASSIANQAIRLLLEDTPLPQRMSALIRQLMASQMPMVNAALLCHPQELEAARQALADHNTTLWVLRADDTVKPQTLLLQTEEGDFCIGWAAMRDAFLDPSRERLDT